MISNYDPHNWYWIVGGDGPHLSSNDSRFQEHSEVYSSLQRGYVPVSDPSYLAWLTDSAHSPTRIASETDLAGVLASQGLRFE